jgi:hypothetical protein
MACRYGCALCPDEKVPEPPETKDGLQSVRPACHPRVLAGAGAFVPIQQTSSTKSNEPPSQMS